MKTKFMDALNFYNEINFPPYNFRNNRHFVIRKCSYLKLNSQKSFSLPTEGRGLIWKDGTAPYRGHPEMTTWWYRDFNK